MRQTSLKKRDSLQYAVYDKLKLAEQTIVICPKADKKGIATPPEDGSDFFPRKMGAPRGMAQERQSLEPDSSRTIRLICWSS